MGLLYLLACSPGFAPDTFPQSVTLDVEPTEFSVVSGPDGGEPTLFEAFATYDNGDVLAAEVVEWSVSNRSAGEVDEAGWFTPSSNNGGTTWVLAKLAGLEGLATVTVIHSDEVVVDEADPTLFDTTATHSLDPSDLAYPPDGVNIPRNTPSIHFQWRDMGADAYRLSFTSGITNISVITTATSWEADEANWQQIASTNAGGTVEVALSASIAGEVHEASPITIHVNRMDARGSIIYWSTGAAGLREIPYGEPANEYLTSSQTGRCVGCHAISTQGYVAFTYDGGDGALGIKRIDDLSDVVGDSSGIHANFKTFSPDGRFLLGSSNGALTLYDGATGATLYDIAVDGTATHVDWSPDGSRVAMVLTEEHRSDWDFSGGVIAVMDHVGDGSFDSPYVLVDWADETNSYYPAWSPDSRWIAFNRSTGDSYDDPDATLYVIDADDGDPIRLGAANQASDLTNSWPRWGPLPDDDILWLAFASKRDYGHVTSATPQIWLAAFDPERAKDGDDPSWPAFWLPDQEPYEGNHIPVWVDE